MKAFRSVTSHAAVLDRPDVDTDQIVPKQFLKRIDRVGFGEFLFYDWRKDPDFELNQPAWQGARILLAGSNFACGSSREHAAWALQDFGFDAIVAPSYGDIFRTNAAQVGLLPVVLPDDVVKRLMEVASTGASLTVDLEQQTVTPENGDAVRFEIDAFVRHCLLEGLDSIGLTLEHEDDIAAFEAAHPSPIATTAL
jgi:3-isopropylmalate/(R)-2-methylmalate dehydratase small subunit